MRWSTKKASAADAAASRKSPQPAGVSALAALRKLIEKLFAIGLWLTTSSSTSPSLYHRPRPQHYTQLYPGSKGMSLE
jgi:hypothetical protein